MQGILACGGSLAQDNSIGKEQASMNTCRKLRSRNQQRNSNAIHIDDWSSNEDDEIAERSNSDVTGMQIGGMHTHKLKTWLNPAPIYERILWDKSVFSMDAKRTNINWLLGHI